FIRDDIRREKVNAVINGYGIAVEIENTFVAIHYDPDISPGIDRQCQRRFKNIILCRILRGNRTLQETRRILWSQENPILGVTAKIEDALPCIAAAPIDPCCKRLNVADSGGK